MDGLEPLDIPRALEETRLDRGMSKAAASRSIEVTRLTYDMWEKGAWIPNIENTDRIARFLEVSRARVLEALLRLNGLLDDDQYLELKRY